LIKEFEDWGYNPVCKVTPIILHGVVRRLLLSHNTITSVSGLEKIPQVASPFIFFVTLEPRVDGSKVHEP